MAITTCNKSVNHNWILKSVSLILVWFVYITLQSSYIVYGNSGYLSERLNLKRVDEPTLGGGGGGVRLRGGHSMILAKANLRNRSTHRPS